VSSYIRPDLWIRAPFWVVTTIYIAFAVRLLYGEGWGRTILKAVWLRFGLFVAEAAVLAVGLFVAVAMTFRAQ
jgi:hypothetical protein